MDEFPKTYDVPRNGEVVQVSVRNREELRAVRTELELFRCIRRQLRTAEAAQVYRIPGKYSESDLKDLKGIASDAHYSSLDGLIEQIDREFTGLREEMTMASVHEEAERIAHEVSESGAALATEESAKEDGVAASHPAPAPKPKRKRKLKPKSVSETTPENQPVAETDSDPVSGGDGDDQPVHEALVEAEAELARVVGVKPEPVSAPVADGSCDDESESAASDEETREDEATPEETANVTADTQADSDQQPSTESHEAVAETVEEGATPADEQVEQPAAVIEVCEEGVSEVAAQPAQVESTAVDNHQQPSEQPTPMPAKPSDHAEPPPPQDAPVPWTPDRAERAVGEIEAGIRKLAGVLTNEVNDQWGSAKVALEEIQSIRSQLGQANEQSRQILDELNRMKEQVGIARAETDIARREARLFREDAKRAKERAKERADRCADAAEQSANNTTLERENALASESPS